MGPNNRSKDLVSVPCTCQITTINHVRRLVCLPRPLLTHHRTCRAGRYCMPDNIPLCVSRPLRVRRIHLSWTDIHLWKAQGTNGELVNSGVLWHTPSGLHDVGVWGSSQQMDVDTLTDCCGVGFWQSWSETCIPVPSWESLCRERAVLRLNRIADTTRYLYCWCVVALMRPCPVLLEYWPVSRNIHQAREIIHGDTANLLATRRMDEPSRSTWTAWATSQGCRYPMMSTLVVIGPNAKGKHWISNIDCH